MQSMIRRILGFTGLLVLSSGTFAQSDVADRYYSVAATISVDGREIFHPNAVVVANQPARIEVGNSSTGSYRVDFTVRPGKRGHVDDQSVVDVALYSKVAGNWVLRSQPTLEVWNGLAASVQSPYQEGVASPRVVDLSIMVTPKPKDDLLRQFNGQIPLAQACPSDTPSRGNALKLAPGRDVTPMLRAACCSAACQDGSGHTLKCCNVVSCSDCGTGCSP